MGHFTRRIRPWRFPAVMQAALYWIYSKRGPLAIFREYIAANGSNPDMGASSTQVLASSDAVLASAYDPTRFWASSNRMLASETRYLSSADDTDATLLASGRAFRASSNSLLASAA